jgi:chemotaxis signal transduction protein
MGPATDTEREANIYQPDTFITVTFEGDVYGLPLSIVRYVVVVTDITPVPLAPVSIAGFA